MAEIIWTEPALENLNDIAEYIAINNISAAEKLVDNVFQTVSRLELFPKSGPVPEEIADFDYREVIVNPCRVLYKIDQNFVYILHVLRQERKLRKYMLNEIENG